MGRTHGAYLHLKGVYPVTQKIPLWAHIAGGGGAVIGGYLLNQYSRIEIPSRQYTDAEIMTNRVYAGMALVIVVAGVLILREVRRQKHPTPRASQATSQATGAKPYAKGRRDNPHKRKYYPVNGDNRVTPSPQPQEHPEIPERIIEGVMRMNLDRATAIRLLEWTASRHPKEGWGWVAEKVILDLERDRSRA